MIFWILLFLLILLISFVLAFQSMKDFAEKPERTKNSYGLFLIKNLKAVNSEFLKLLHNQLISKGLIFSIEKLFKGSKVALVIFGPKEYLQGLSHVLDLVELEDYTNVNPSETVAWEVNTAVGSLIGNPRLMDDEQFWWQVILKPQKKLIGGYHDLVKTRSGSTLEDSYFKCQIRAVVWVKNDNRRGEVAQKLQQKIPIPFTSSQILKMYQDRSIITSVPATDFTAERVIDLIDHS